MNIALDIGHAKGTGARGNDLEEHEVATVIVRHLSALLRENGHSVTVIDFPEMSNADDLAATIEAANRNDYDLGISVHCDCSDNSSAKGAHVCYLSSRAKILAEAIADPLVSLLPGRAQMIVPRPNLAVLKRTKPTWVLVECGFISNLHDSNVMRESPELIAQAIGEGIRKFLRTS